MKPVLSTLSTLLLFQSVHLPAASINVNFTGVSGREVTGTAGVSPATNWTNLGGSSGNASALADDSGTPTTAAVDYQAMASWQSGTPTDTQDARLMDGYLAVGDTDYNYVITVTGVPYGSYDVYVYFGNNAMGADGNIRLNGGGTQIFYEVAGILPTFTGFQEATGRQPGETTPGNYVLFEGVSGDTLVIQQANVGGGQDSGVMGFQIVERATAVPAMRLNESVFSNDEPVVVDFANGPGAAENNLVIVPFGGDPATEAATRLYVGGGATPTTGETSGTVTFPNAGGQFSGWFDLYFLSDASGTVVLDGPETFQVVPPDPVPVAVGGGSYASGPPAHEGEGVLFEAYQRPLYIDPSAQGRPVPTNDWWTHLIISQYAGVMWAYPLALSMDNRGVNVFHPASWAAGGGEMLLTGEVEIGGRVEPVVDPDVILIADFEGTAYPAGWTTTGTAFGAGPAAGTLAGQSTVSGYLGERLANSFNGGDGPTGTLTSPPFTIERTYIHFLVGGGSHPGTAAVSLLINGTVVRSTTGENSETLLPHRWDVSEFDGQTATIEIVDQETGGWGHVLADQIFQADNPDFAAGAAGTTFAPVAADALDWGDWTVTARLRQRDTQFLDVTFGHGLPYVWVEATGVDPTLDLPGLPTFFDENGTPVTLDTPASRDVLGIQAEGRTWGLFLPDGSTITREGSELLLGLPPNARWFVFAIMPAAGDIATYRDHAYALPRDSVYTWDYDPTLGRVRTQWELVMEQLRGTNDATLQGWIPHHYRTTDNDLDFSSGIEFGVVRGRLRCATGRTFRIDFPFAGITPNTPPPATTGLPNDFDPGILAQEIARAATRTDYGAETYFGGKDLGRYAQYLAAAFDTNHPSANTLRNTLRNALADWYTYTPDEREHYFARYPRWGALVGFNESFGSAAFTDHHFHYGYHTIAAGTLGLYDPAFLDQYGAMARLVAKEYANWERDDPDFPYLRTFDIWKGHSQAGGYAGPVGNNQESSSEATQSWAGLFFLGRALGDDAMTAAGAMGHAVESAATMEYWFNYNGDTLAPNYPKHMVGILFDRGPAYATYFSGDPAWIHGIQWIPLHPAVMQYFSDDPAFARDVWDALKLDRAASEFGPLDIAPLGSSLGNILMGYTALFDTNLAAQEWNRLDSINSPVVEDNDIGGITYYYIHSMRAHGTVDDTFHLSEPLGNALHDARTDTTTFVVFNPTDTEQTVTVYSEGTPVGCLIAAPNALTWTTELQSCNAGMEGTWMMLY